MQVNTRKTGRDRLRLTVREMQSLRDAHDLCMEIANCCGYSDLEDHALAGITALDGVLAELQSTEQLPIE